MELSETGYYKWLRNEHKPRRWQHTLNEMHEVLKEREENDNYGVERMRIALEKRGIKVSKSTVRRVMAIGNLLHKCHKSPDGVTVADKKAMRPKNILARDFTASMPNEKWLTDITQVKCRDGILYIAAVFS